MLNRAAFAAEKCFLIQGLSDLRSRVDKLVALLYACVWEKRKTGLSGVWVDIQGNDSFHVTDARRCRWHTPRPVTELLWCILFLYCLREVSVCRTAGRAVKSFSISASKMLFVSRIVSAVGNWGEELYPDSGIEITLLNRIKINWFLIRQLFEYSTVFEYLQLRRNMLSIFYR